MDYLFCRGLGAPGAETGGGPGAGKGEGPAAEPEPGGPGLAAPARVGEMKSKVLKQLNFTSINNMFSLFFCACFC